MIFHPEVLSKEQRQILPALAQCASASGFYLGGGTAVAIYLGHRMSIDFDWFTHEKIDDPMVLAGNLRECGLDIQVSQTSRGTLHSVVQQVQVSFFEYPYQEVADPVSWPEFSLKLASLDDLACMKLVALAQRGARKDFIDVYALATQHKPLPEMLALYQQKYSTRDIAHILVALSYFDEADGQTSPVMLQDVPWDAIKHEFREWAKALAS